MRRTILIATMLAAASAASAQAPSPPAAAPPPSSGAACPPGTPPNAPTLNGQPNQNLSDKLAGSSGVICPPAGVDNEMQKRPPQGGEIRVIPPPSGGKEGQPK